MLNQIVNAALRYKVLVLVGFVLLVVFGVRAFQQVPVDAFPADVTPNQVSIYTESPIIPQKSLKGSRTPAARFTWRLTM